MSIYKLPVGIRLPTKEEYPSNLDFEEIDAKRSAANIVQGYKLFPVENQKYTHFLEVNVDADKIWDLFRQLVTKIKPDISYCIIGFKDDSENDFLSDFLPTYDILELLSEYSYELTNDGYLTFGAAYYNEKILNEIYVSSFKYLKIWTEYINEVIKILKQFGLNENEELNFIDEFPVCSCALIPDENNGIRHYSEVTENIKTKLKELKKCEYL